jgi:hypothetical protein
MTLEEVKNIFNRAAFGAIYKAKLFLTFIVLALCGILVVFFRGVAVGSSPWLAQSLTFLPVFICAGILLSLGIPLIRIYHDEIKERPISYKKTMQNSWEVVIGSSYFSVPIILCYLLLWMMLGIFVLLSKVPGVGEFFAVILAFGPFLINLGTLTLLLLSLALLFYVAPVLALRGFSGSHVSRILALRFKRDLFSNLFLLMIAVTPLLAVGGLLIASALLSGSLYYLSSNPVHTVLFWFFTMIPFTAILSPMVVFFFNFAAEAHVLIMKKQQFG